MPTNDLTPEKRIATTLSDLPDLGHPPVPDPETFASPDPDAVIDEPPTTRLLLEGFDPEEITTEFLTSIHDAGDDHGLTVESISVGQPESDDR